MLIKTKTTFTANRPDLPSELDIAMGIPGDIVLADKLLQSIAEGYTVIDCALLIESEVDDLVTYSLMRDWSNINAANEYAALTEIQLQNYVLNSRIFVGCVVVTE